MRILFVEDQRVFAETVASRFLAAHEVVIAETIAAARATFAVPPGFDAVLVDYDLPDGKGVSMVEHLRALRFKGLIVAVSAKDDGNAALRAAGAHATCKKAELHQIEVMLQRWPAR
jgi:two-component system response regulator TctD